MSDRYERMNGIERDSESIHHQNQYMTYFVLTKYFWVNSLLIIHHRILNLKDTQSHLFTNEDSEGDRL